MASSGGGEHDALRRLPGGGDRVLDAGAILGIDAEPHAPLPDGVLDHTSIEAEREVLATRDTELHWDRLLFCAKEATYKAWFPITQRWLGFEDAHITFERDDTIGTAGACRYLHRPS